ncbi:MAG TPA: dihydrodipicolinate synthase family protein [Candidatus Acidoferrales bacterium]|nr:dihydrodipicolinate synthase family protein [Candidatus Acidoferrales bacterium]
MRLQGVWPAVVTPVDAALRPDSAKAIEYYAELLDGGADGLNVLGTTGEAMSFGAGTRAAFMEEIAASGLPVDRIMIGTGAACLDDAAALTRRAFDLHFAAALVMPPFFFRDAGDDGVVAYFERLFARAEPPRGGVLLYNFPAVSGIAFAAPLLDRLLAEFPEPIAGMKDSSNDRALQCGAIERHPGLAVFPSSEADLLEARGRGAAGCISATIALSLPSARRALDAGDVEEARRLACRRAAFANLPLVAAMKATIAKQRLDPGWERAMPPLQALPQSQRTSLEAALRRCL